MTKKEMQLLFEYDQWADLKILEVIAKLNGEQYKKDLGSSFDGIQGTLVHILSADRIWLDRWSGKTPVLLKTENFPTVEVVKKQWNTYNFEVGNFIMSVSEEQLNKHLEYTNFKGDTYAYPLYQQIQHKINHSTYHRGQIVTMLRQLGVDAVSTDIIKFIEQKEKCE